ncbi:transcription factor A, mitochondrial [Myiozetetes cayanensis]|uniref:transcription factor A, mitochondrial n=1 Tax=Myiozetetes cayanensis TaxID=478635 RepID=UPI00215E7626|nr:transcription factor A, mitochondrial [Myiozetetes cayanensis]
MAALLGWAAGLGMGLVAGGRRLLRAGGAAEQCLWRGISSAQRPKRPLTAYFRFMKENRPAFKEKNPEVNSVDLLKIIAGAWKELPASQKQVYKEAGKTDWQRYEEQLTKYKAQLTPAQVAALKEERRKQLARRRSLRAKRELAMLGKPKRPRTALNIFVSEKFQESEGVSPTARLKKVFDAWQKLSASQRQPYLQLSEDDKVRYENEMKLWEAKMLELGREDLVRSKKKRLRKKPAETAKAAETARTSLGKKAKLKLKKAEE